MKQKDKEVMQRMLGKIEGVAFMADEEIAAPLFDALEIIDCILDKEECEE